MSEACIRRNARGIILGSSERPIGVAAITKDTIMKSKPVWSFGIALLAVLYACAALLADALATQGVQVPIDWTILIWRNSNHFDFFKFTFWLLLPFLVCLHGLDWGWYGLKRWARLDWWILIAGLMVGAAAIVVASLEPSLQRVYGGIAYASAQEKWTFVEEQLIWTFSWLLGWEFLHRYFLPKALAHNLPRRGGVAAMILIPCSEGLYHLQKPLLEAGGMVLFSLASTWWVLRRRNALLPLIIHLAIECQLIAMRVIT